MATAKIDDATLMERLSGIFRRYGYEGASLSILARETGLSRASLYHRFPGGKEDMAEAVIGHVERHFQDHVMAAAVGPGTPEDRLRETLGRLKVFYGAGAKPCLLDTLSLLSEDAGARRIRDRIASTSKACIDALQKLSRDAGHGAAEARRRALEAMVQIEGGLVMARAMDDPKVFGATLKRLPVLLLA